MEIIKKNTPNYTEGREDTPIDRIVIHWIGAGTATSTIAWFGSEKSQVSAHFLVSEKNIYQFVDEDDTAWHSGNWEMNQRSIGIEHDATPDRELSDESYKTSAQLVADICKRHSIPLDREHIIAHKEVKATQCCGTVSVEKIIAMARELTSSTYYENRIKELEVELDEMRASRNEWKRKYGELEEKYERNMKEKNEHIEAQQKTISELNMHNSSLTRDKEILLSENNALKDQIKVLEDQLKECSGVRVSLEEQLLKSGEARNELENQLTECNKKVRTKLCKYSWREFAITKLKGCK